MVSPNQMSAPIRGNQPNPGSGTPKRLMSADSSHALGNIHTQYGNLGKAYLRQGDLGYYSGWCYH